MEKKEAVQLKESKRVYHFPNNETVVLENVTELIVSASGNHRLKTADKKLHIVPTGWNHIEIHEKDWTV